MNDEQPRSSTAAPLWIIAILLAVIVVGAGAYFIHQHDVTVKKQQDAENRAQFQPEAEIYCSLQGFVDESPTYKNCVEDRIDEEIANGGE